MGYPEPIPDPAALTVELWPAEAPPDLRERLKLAVALAAPHAKLVIVAVVARLEPVADGRPPAIALRIALKRVLRGAGLKAKWNGTVGRPPRPKRKAKPMAARRKVVA